MIPEGMRDVLPGEAAELHVLEETLRSRFAAYGYGEVRTSTLEFAETFQAADDDVLGAGFRVFDDQGRTLMLRTEMTTPVARLAGTRLRDEPLPLRLCYVANSYRPMAASRGLDGEFEQVGAELLGEASPEADAEVVALLCDCLAAAGLKGFKVALGTVAFHTALVESMKLPPDQAEAAREALAERDYPLLESIISNAGVGEDAVRALQKALQLSGGGDALSQARRLAGGAGREDAVDRLVRVRDVVEELGFGDVIELDFGLTPEFSYYTGVVFEAYAPGVGLPVATGGRYDELPAALDWPIPAVGFAVSLDRLNVALEEAGAPPATPARPLAVAGGLQEPALVAELRRAGLAVVAMPTGGRQLPAPSLRRAGGDWLLDLGGGREVHGSLRDVRRALGLS
jgi:ATP phosphoribosyltransferase regulatory subunit